MLSQNKKLRVAVLVGGPSSEHEVSLKSGENVIANLDPARYQSKRVLIDKNGEWEIPVRHLNTYADIAFLALHGPYGEDGTIQDILQSHKIPYTGSGPMQSALAMNKFLSYKLFKQAGFNVPLTFLVTKSQWQDQPMCVLHQIRHYLNYPIIVKPNNQGSSVGVSIVRKEDGLTAAFNEIFALTREAVIQEYVFGRELTCGVLDHGLTGSEFALLPTEIVPQTSNFFDYRAKYEPEASLEITPPISFNEPAIKNIQKTAVGIHRLIGCRGFSRTDMIMDKHGQIYVLEINTIPGLTTGSLLPKAALASGIGFSVLLDKIIAAGFYHHPFFR